MGQSSEKAEKPSVSIKMAPGREKQLRSNLETLQEHYGALLSRWGELTPEQRKELLLHSPLLAGYIALFGGLSDG